MVYRPPNQNVDEFLTMTNELLSKISKENKVCYLMGDFNLNQMNHQSHSVTGEFLDALHSNMVFPLITRPTRITCHSATLIDNIFVNQFFDRSRSGLFFTDISDHLPIFSIHFDTSISVSNKTVFVRDVKVFLGVVLDEHLSWKPHISKVARKISKSIGVINRARSFLPKLCLKTLYYCLVYPYLHYCIIVWGSTYKTNLRRLVSLQKRGIRIISKSTFDSHSDPIFKELELLKLSDIRQLELGKLMFSLNHSLLPSKFNDYFSLNKQVHSYATRHANDFHLPFCRTNLRKFSVSFQGPTYYNSIENDIKESNSLHLFKTKLKKNYT